MMQIAPAELQHLSASFLAYIVYGDYVHKFKSLRVEPLERFKPFEHFFKPLELSFKNLPPYLEPLVLLLPYQVLCQFVTFQSYKIPVRDLPFNLLMGYNGLQFFIIFFDNRLSALFVKITQIRLCHKILFRYLLAVQKRKYYPVSKYRLKNFSQVKTQRKPPVSGFMEIGDKRT